MQLLKSDVFQNVRRRASMFNKL